MDPVLVGFELGKLKKKNPTHYQANCPACRTVNKVSVREMQSDLDSVAEEIQAMLTEHAEAKAKARAEKQAKAREKSEQQKSKKKGKSKAQAK